MKTSCGCVSVGGETSRSRFTFSGVLTWSEFSMLNSVCGSDSEKTCEDFRAEPEHSASAGRGQRVEVSVLSLCSLSGDTLSVIKFRCVSLQLNQLQRKSRGNLDLNRNLRVRSSVSCSSNPQTLLIIS